MMHPNRRFCLTNIDDSEELAEKLTQHTWTGCTAFEHDGYLFLNDATCADGAQEYAVFKKGSPSAKPVQIESITFSWMDADNALLMIRDIIRGEYDDVMSIEQDVTFETPDEHGRCHLCM